MIILYQNPAQRLVKLDVPVTKWCMCETYYEVTSCEDRFYFS